MTSTTEPSLRITDPASLVALVPYLLGFHPEASLVLVALGQDAQVVLSARVDLPGRLPRGGLGPLRTAAAQIGGAAARSAARSAVAVLYLPTRPDLLDQRWGRVAATVTGGLQGAGLTCRDVLAVAERRWWSLQCHDATCCPVEGTALPGVGTSAAEVAAIASGLVARGSRADVAGLLAPAGDLQRVEVSAALGALAAPLEDDRSGGDPAGALGAVDAALRGWRDPVTADVAARVIAAIDDVRVRDAVVVCPPGGADAAIQLWTTVVRLAPDDRAAPAATLLAAAAYQRGDGALAGLALERAFAADPAYSLAGLIAASLSAGVPPLGLFEALAEPCDEARASLLGIASKQWPSRSAQDEAEVS